MGDIVIKTAKRICCVLLALAACQAGASVVPQDVVSGIPHQALFSVDFDGRNAVAVGAGGEILASADGGKSWQPETAPSRLSLLGVTVQGSQRIAVGIMGQILRKDGSSAWKAVDSGTQERLFAVSMNASGQAVAVGSFGTLLVSEDAGRSWSARSPDWNSYFQGFAETLGDGFSPHLYAVRVDEAGHILVAGEMNTILRSDDQGRSWTLLHRGDLSPDGRASIFAMDIGADGEGYAVGQLGLVLKTRDGGASWARVAADTKANLLGVAVGRSGKVTVTAMRELLLSSDGGASWQKVGTLDVKTGWYAAAATAPDSGEAYAVGHSGRIIRFAP